VDKTVLIHQLVGRPSGQYFLSRPRRFGKSLLVSTLKAIFQGRRELFQGLAIHDLPFDWKTHPVIHIDLGDQTAVNAADMERNLSGIVGEQALANGVELRRDDPSGRFRELVLALSARGTVVILVDEYDKPLLGALGDAGKARELLPVMKQFYSVIKATEPLQRFALLTGVSKFSKVSVFSDLNNLTDLTLDGRYATLLGYTQEELETNFVEYLDRLVVASGLTRDALLAKIRDWYNGYRFVEDATTVYNPVSVMRLFDTNRFANYWFETGTPTFLVDLLKAARYDLPALEINPIPEIAFSAYEVDQLRVEPLLFQTGYLTIKNYDKTSGLYTLGYPNKEVNDSFAQYLVDAFTPVRKELAAGEAYRMVMALESGCIEEFMERMRAFFAGIDYDLQINHEKYYQTIFYLVVKLLGIYVSAEVKTSQGRIDVVVETKSRIFIFEFKLHGTADEALAQIKNKRYFEKYLSDGRPITLVGVAFDLQTRNLGDFLAESLK